tara:strand:- start:455 stop:736 length:282 start_codon:yes stop_codon:yes gene_type:complete
MVSAFGDLMNETKKDKIAFKKRMLIASGCTFPDDWDKLPIEEQESRINKALEVNDDYKPKCADCEDSGVDLYGDECRNNTHKKTSNPNKRKEK